ncbi:PadR family transcriptional regulator [Paenibacillus sp. J2TS4]|uniref:PadR family transcriptional regulator n=1 Tax=Paenibacillus sp. J2TS4 TaxID=2807194 RepID=UPI001B24E1AD|nr:PadR family transcriptional regulator [Paenibacillus sp. J2TS4]GIP32482.1 transcriptional regulator [Paenibacillus sp. J2TS4]
MSMKLAILGLLMEKNNHPYEMLQEMKEREMHNYMKIQYGSLYYAIDQLKKDGLIEKVEVTSEGNRPEKTIYRITEEGTKQFQTMLLEQMRKSPRITHPLFAALSFAQYGDQAQITEIILMQIQDMEQMVHKMRNLYEEHTSFVSRSNLHMLWGGYLHAVTELNWLKALYEDAKAGRLTEIGGPLEEGVDELEKA